MKTSPYYLLSLAALVVVLSACNPPQQEPTSNEAPETAMAAPQKPIIYQLLPRLFSNTNTTRKPWGSLEENGVGKFSGINDAALTSLKDLGVTHVWYTGVLEHATATAYPSANIPADDADVVKGIAGSPYAIKDYYDLCPALADDPSQRMTEFEALLARTHAHGLKALIDFVPNHVARSYHSDAKPADVQDLGQTDDKTKAFDPNNNFYYLPGTAFAVPKPKADQKGPLRSQKLPGEDGQYAESPAKATGNNVFNAAPSIDDWFETAKLNYGIDMQAPDQPKHFEPVPSTWVKMTDILLFWASKGVDGFRCDVAEMVPVEFWMYAIPAVKAKFPKVIFIAEIYTPSIYQDYAGKGGFDYLYDKVGLYDKVRPLMAGDTAAKVEGISEALQQSEGIDGQMLRFLENHDEQRIASKDFAGDAKAAIPGMTVTTLLGTGPTLVYFGQESGEKGEGAEGFGGEDGRTTIFDYWGVPAHQAYLNGGKYDGGGLDEDQKALRQFYSALFRIAQSPAFVSGQRLILPTPAPGVFAFLRYGEGNPMLVIANFNAASNLTVDLDMRKQVWEQIGVADPGLRTPEDLLLPELQAKFGAEFPKAYREQPSSEGAYQVFVPAWGARVISFAPKG